MMAKAKPNKKRKRADTPDYVVLMVPQEVRRQVNCIAQHTGETAPEVVKRVAGTAIFAEFRKLVTEG